MQQFVKSREMTFNEGFPIGVPIVCNDIHRGVGVGSVSNEWVGGVRGHKYDTVQVGQVDLLELVAKVEQLTLEVARLKAQHEQLWYAPGMPGAVDAEHLFENHKNEI